MHLQLIYILVTKPSGMNRIKFITVLLLLNCSAIAQKGHSINSNSIIKQLPKITPKKSGNEVINKSNNHHPANPQKTAYIKVEPKNKANNKSEQGSKPKKGK